MFNWQLFAKKFLILILTTMPLNHQNTKTLQKEFNVIPTELDEIGKKIVHAARIFN